MPSKEKVEALKQRIAQLEGDLAQAKEQLEEATKHHHVAPGEDAEWGQFNPG